MASSARGALDASTREYTRTSFTLVDLAGAERESKVKDEAAKNKEKGAIPLDPSMMSNMIQVRPTPVCLPPTVTVAACSPHTNICMI